MAETFFTQGFQLGGRSHRVAARDYCATGAQASDHLGTTPLTQPLIAAHAAIAAGQLPDAFEILRVIIQHEPNCIPAFLAMGQLLYLNQDFVASAGCYHKILSRDPQHMSARIHLGLACLQAGDVAQAYQLAKTASAGLLLSAIDHGNLSVLFLDLGRFREALRQVDAALALTPDDPELHCRRGILLLTLGRYPEGWAEYEWRRGMTVSQLQAGNWRDTSKTVEALYGIPSDKPRWQGDPIDHLVIHYEHAFGDTLQWSRFVPHAAQRCQRVTLVVPTPMLGLMQDSFTCTVSDTLPNEFDAYVWLDSLPLLFKADTRMTACAPYLRTSCAARWQARLGSFKRLRVGLVWAGRPGLQTDQWRSIQFAQLDELLCQNVDFFSLQKGDSKTCTHLRLFDLAPMIATWQDTAGAISAMDLVIGVDTSVVHLAGAMGKPVWLLNRFNTCWRWLLDRSTSPWYPTMRIFRQPSFGDWDSVMIQVAKALRRIANTN